MKIKKITMETDEGVFEYRLYKEKEVKSCAKCAFRHTDCYDLPMPCSGGYWKKVEEKEKK